jgi:hypothetical protein
MKLIEDDRMINFISKLEQENLGLLQHNILAFAWFPMKLFNPLIPWSRVLFYYSIFDQIIKKFPTSAYHWCLF